MGFSCSNDISIALTGFGFVQISWVMFSWQMVQDHRLPRFRVSKGGLATAMIEITPRIASLLLCLLLLGQRKAQKMSESFSALMTDELLPHADFLNPCLREPMQKACFRTRSTTTRNVNLR